MQPQTCPQCGEKTEADAHFCGNCGRSLVLAAPGVAGAGAAGPPVQPPPAAIPAYAIPDPAAQKGESKAFWALMLAALSLPALVLPFIGLPMAITAVVFGHQVRRQPSAKSVATAALVVGYLSIGLYAAFVLFAIAYFATD